MARIHNYPNDSVIQVTDKIIGTDVSAGNATKNFTIGDLTSYLDTALAYTAGTGIDITNGVISCTIVDTDTDTTYTAGTGIDITNEVISVTNPGSVDYIDDIVLNGNELQFTSVGHAHAAPIDLTPILPTPLSAGTGVDITGSTISCTVTDTDTTYTAGTGIDITNEVISSTVAAPTVTEEVVAIANPLAGLNATPQSITFKTVTNDPTTGSLHYNPSQGNLILNPDTLANDSGVDLTIKVSMTAFVEALSNNETIIYNLDYWDGAAWQTLKAIQRKKSATGEFADSIFAYFKLPANSMFRIQASSPTGNIVINDNSNFEFQVKE